MKMKTTILAIAATLMLGATAQARWYAGPVAAYAYYPVAAPAYVCPAPVVVPGSHVVYSPVMAPAPVVAPLPVWVGPPAVVVGPTGKVYIPGRPVRNTVRAVLP